MLKKNDIITVVISDLGSEGEGVSKFNEYVVFVPYALIGERINVKVLKVKGNIVFAKIVKILTRSSERVEAVCPQFFRCGGCQLQHLSYEGQLKLKREIVKNNIKKIAKLDFDVACCLPSEKQYGYRNKMQLPVGSEGMGFYASNTHTIVPISSCPLHEEWATKVIEIVYSYIKLYNIACYNEESKKGAIRHIVCRFLQQKLMLVIVSAVDKLENSNYLIERLSREFASFSLYLNYNNKDTNVVMGEKFTLIYGDSEQQIDVDGLSYSVSPQSFLQVNTSVQNKIYFFVQNECCDYDYVIDAYSGAGLLSALIAKKSKEVYGIEIVPSATENANKLAKNNNITNLKNINGDCAIELPKLITTLSGKGAVVLDPPRKGCDEKVLRAIMECNIEKIVYISCNSATLARDINILKENYNLTSVVPYDMFPNTKHVETVVVLNRK